MSKSVFPAFEDIDFEIEKEVWNIYELIEGKHRVTLKMRAILTKLLRHRFVKDEPPPPGIPPGAKKVEFGMSFKNVVIVSSCPPDLMGKPSGPIPPAEFQKLPREEVEFNPFYEDWNVYKIKTTPPMKMKVKLVVSSVESVKGKFDQFGYPIYNVHSTNAIAPMPPKKRKRR